MSSGYLHVETVQDFFLVCGGANRGDCLNYGVLEVTGGWGDGTLYGNYCFSPSPGHRAK